MLKFLKIREKGVNKRNRESSEESGGRRKSGKELKELIKVFRKYVEKFPAGSDRKKLFTQLVDIDNGLHILEEMYAISAQRTLVEEFLYLKDDIFSKDDEKFLNSADTTTVAP